MADEHDPASAPPAPPPQTTGRTIRRAALRLLLMLLLVLLLSAGAVLLFPDQLLAPLVLRAAASAAADAGGELTATSLRGGLRGPWIVEGLRWRALEPATALRDLRVARVELAASPWDLLAGRAGWLHAVSASGVDVRLDLQAEPAAPAQRSLRDLTERLGALPQVQVDHALVHAVLRGGRSLEATELSLGVGPPGASREIALDVTALHGLGAGPAPATVHVRCAWDGRALDIAECSLVGGALDGLALLPGARVELAGTPDGAPDPDALRFSGTVSAPEGSCALAGGWAAGVVQSHLHVEGADIGALWRRLRAFAVAAPGARSPSGRLALDGDVSVPLASPRELTGVLDVSATALALADDAGPHEVFDRLGGRLGLGAGAARLFDVELVQGDTSLQAHDLSVPFGVRSLRDVVLQGGGRLHLSCRDVPALLAAAGVVGPAGRAVPEHALELTALLDRGAAELLDGSLTTPGGTLAVQRGRIDLSGDDLLDAPLDVDAQADFTDLSPLGPILDPLSGLLRGAAGAGRWAGSLAGSVHAEGSLRDVRARVELSGQKVVLAGWPLGELALRFTADRRMLVLETLDSQSRAANLRARGRCDLASAELSDVELSLELADASRLPVDGLSGSLALEARASGPLRAPVASLSLRSEGLALRGLQVRRLELEAQAQGGRLDVERLAAATSLGDVSARGAVSWSPGQPTIVELQQLAASDGDLDLALAAPVTIAIDGGRWRCGAAELSGTAGRLVLTAAAPAGGGTQELVLHAERLRPAPLLVLALPGQFALTGLDGDLRAAWGGGALQAEGALQVTGLSCRLGGPAGRGAQLSGDVTARLALAGSISAPRGTLELDANRLALSLPGDEAGHTLGNSLVAARLRLDEHGVQLTDLTINAPQRVRLNAHGSIGAVPDLGALAGAPGSPVLPAGAPLDVELHLSAGDLAFLAALLSDVRRVEGVLGADVAVRGTLAEPDVTGTVTVSDGELRLASGFPALDALSARMEFAGRTATIRELKGELGSAPFEVTGRFGLLPDGAALDITLRGEDLLLYRGDGVKVRADTDVQVSGTLAALTARGSLSLRDSRFERNVNFLHMAAGAGARTGGGLQLFSFHEPPLSTMALDLRVTATEPLEVHNNIADGGVSPDLHLGGTGLVPVVEGTLALTSMRVALPAGSVRSTGGRVDFGGADPFHPVLDISAKAQMRGYDITIAITGAYDQPRVTLSSVPPLPSDDLLLLVLTGQPPGEGPMLGSGARNTFAVYLGQDLLARWLGEEGGHDDSLLDRLDVEIARDVTRPNEDIMRVSYRLTGQPDVKNPLTFLSAEKDIYDRVNFGLQFLYKLP